MKIIAEYIWLDGSKPTSEIRSKTKVFSNHKDILSEMTLSEFPEWTFDGSSTNQATGDKSDCILRPVCFVPDSTRHYAHNSKFFLVLCEVFNASGSPHKTNTRATLRSIVESTIQHDPLFGIEQEYTMFLENRPLGWQNDSKSVPEQGPFYCGVGVDKIFGRKLVEEHLTACLNSGIEICGINAEVMPGQWEYQIGTCNALTVSDHLILSRWLLNRIAENHGILISLDAKPVKQLNGAGAHTNFSTNKMRNPGGIAEIETACNKLRETHEKHIVSYGHGIEDRLTGHHETCSYREFRWGVSDRGASIRIPLHVAQNRCGYLEDRRPCANIDPYVVTRLILETVCGE